MTGFGIMAGIASGLALLATSPAPAPFRAERVAAAPAGLAPLPITTQGRVERHDGRFVRQWPGTYFEAAFSGPAILFRVGPGDVALHLAVDGRAGVPLVKPAPGLYRLAGLSSGRHRLRIDVVSESQAGPTRLGPFYAPRGAVLPPPAGHTRQIEYIGDSHTVGYGVTSAKRDCTEDEVWATTDTSRGFAALLARAYDADYQVNAISGRGVVRNYDGLAAATLPQAYPFTLFDRRSRATGPGWQPQVIVIALGTNDFSTALHAGERWAGRTALHADYEATYVRFVQGLRARNPSALIVLWSTDLADGEITAEVAQVAAALRAAGERRLATVAVAGLAFSGCHAHPSLADQQVIARRIGAAIDQRKDVWRR